MQLVDVKENDIKKSKATHHC